MRLYINLIHYIKELEPPIFDRINNNLKFDEDFHNDLT